MSRLKWNGAEVEEMLGRVEEAVAANAAVILSDEVAASMPGRGAGVKGKTASGRNIYKPSDKFEPPGVRTGRLRSSIKAARTSAGKWIMRPGVEYAKFLELGTSKMADRNFMLSTSLKDKVQKRMVKHAIKGARKVLGRMSG